MSDAATKSDKTPPPPVNLSMTDSSNPVSLASGQNSPKPRQRSADYASSAQTNSSSKSSNPDLGEQPSTGSKSTVILLFTIAADTTWRMFVPIIGGTIGGVWADNTFATKLLWTIVGVSIGVVVAALLVRQQMRKK